MYEIINFINTPTEWAVVIFACIFSLGIALFYTLFIAALFEKDFPGWLFFLLFPFVIILSKVVFNINVLFILILLFLLLAVSFLIWMIFQISKSAVKAIKERSKKEKASSILFSIIINILFLGLAIACFLYFGPATIFVFIFVTAIFKKFIHFNKKNSFLNLQANLPTSKIRSLAMGQVEVKGKVIMKEPLLSRIGKKDCVGYRYKTEEINSRSDGVDHYSTISNVITCNDFNLEDDTGKISVKAENIEFKWIKEDASYRSNNKRYTQYLLFDGDEILIIANANSTQNSTYLEKGSKDTIFTLAPFDSTTLWNRNKPLLNSLLSFFALYLVVLAFILLLDIEVTEKNISVIFNFSWDNFNFQNAFN